MDQNRPEGANLDIDAILARIRNELTDSETIGQDPITGTAPRRRETIVTVPLVTRSGDDAVPIGRTEYTLGDFAALDEEAFLQNAYRVILGRDVDGSGRTNFLPALREGRASYVGVLSALTRSPEGGSRGVRIRRLTTASIFDRLAHLPAIGRIVAPFVQAVTLPQSMRRLNRRIAASDLKHRELIDALNITHSGVRRSLTHLEVMLGAAQRESETIRALAQSTVDGQEGAQAELAASRRVIAEESRQLSRLIETARSALPRVTLESHDAVGAVEAHALDSLYVAFENRFRGSHAEIGTRQARYLPIFKQNPSVASGRAVLDIGSGRGEWLSLLKSHAIVTRGVDLNVAMAEQARSLGLEVHEGDGIAHLRAGPPEILGAITAFHVVEHLAFAELVALFDEAYRALSPGGIVLFETPNPENLVVGACTFNYDPTHRKPLPPDLLRFLAEARGFASTRIIRTEGDCDLARPESGFAPTEINDWFRQPPDYALYAQKPLAPEFGNV